MGSASPPSPDPSPAPATAPVDRSVKLRQFWDVTSPVEETVDVVVVGSGAGGAAAAAELAEAGLSVVILEEGGLHDTRSFHADAPEMVRRLYRDGGSMPVIGRPNITLVQGRCVGGTTVINGGMCWRAPERVLARWRAESGVADLAPGALEPFFAKVEERLHVAEQDPETIGRDDDLLRIGAERLGYKVVNNRRNQDRCMGSNNCAFGCPTGGKQSTLVSYLPRAVAAGARILADCRAERIITERGSGRARGVLARMVDPATGRRGPSVTVRARVATVLAAGATQTPLLLLENGLEGKSGFVGRNFSLHPHAKCVGIFDEEVVGWTGVHQAHQVHEFLDDGFNMAVGYVPPAFLAMSLSLYLGDELYEVLANVNRMVVAGFMSEDTTTGTVGRGLVRGQPLLRYSITAEDVRRLLRGSRIVADILFAAGARQVLTAVHGVPPLRSPDDARALEGRKVHPHDFELLAVHLMGTCRMGVDPRRSVVGPFGEAHHLPGLFIADASVFPSSLGLNPMETIMALATRTAHSIVERSDV
jgi:choline dehydrogenase-like flavoprotein